MTKRRPGRELAKWVAGTAAVLMSLYLCAYYVLVDSAVPFQKPAYWNPLERRAVVFSSEPRWVFAPAHWFDRHVIRRGFWDYEE